MYQYPYGNAQQLNLDWLMEQWQEVKQSIDGSLQGEIDRVEAAITDLLAARDAAVAAAGAAGNSATAAAQSAQAAAADAATASAQAAAANTARSNAAQAANNAQTYAGNAQTQAAAAQNAAGQAAASASQAAASASDAHDDALAASGSATNAATSAAGALQNFQLSDAARQAAQAAAADAEGSAQEAQDILDSIPEDYSDLTDDVDKIKQDLYVYTPDFERGGLNTSGVPNTASYAVRTTDFFTVLTDSYVIVKDGFAGYVWFYPSDAAAYRLDLSSAIIMPDVNVKITITRAVIDQSETANVDEFADAIRIRPSTYENDYISAKSWDIDTPRYAHTTYKNFLDSVPELQQGTDAGRGVDFNTHFKDSPYLMYFETNGTRTSSEVRIINIPNFTLLGTQEFEITAWIPDATKITGIRISIPSSNFVKASTEPLVTGWNKIRLRSEGAGNWSENTDNTQIRIMAYHTSDTEEKIYIGSIVQIMPEYGNCIIVADGPYYTFYADAYPDFADIGVPVTWALDGNQLDSNDAVTRNLINKNELELLAYDGISEFSFHSYNGVIMSTATQEQALADTLQGIRFLKENGLEPEKIWRAAWLQNTCPNHKLADLEVEASASYNSATGLCTFPFIDNYNIPRIGLAGQTTSQIDDIFSKLYKQHCTAIIYFHGISNGTRDVTAETLAYFISKIESALNDGYINPTTYNRLVNYYKEIK